MKTLLLLLTLTLTGIMTLAGFALREIAPAESQSTLCQKAPSQTEYLVRQIWHHEGIDRMQICSLDEETNLDPITKPSKGSASEGQASVLHIQGMNYRSSHTN